MPIGAQFALLLRGRLLEAFPRRRPAASKHSSTVVQGFSPNETLFPLPFSRAGKRISSRPLYLPRSLHGEVRGVGFLFKPSLPKPGALIRTGCSFQLYCWPLPSFWERCFPRIQAGRDSRSEVIIVLLLSTY